jgi:transcriptional regulator with XRE-family HTH domain
MAEPNVEMGKRIKKWREELGDSQAELAKMCGVSVTSVKNWERGAHPPGRKMKRLSIVLGRTPAEITGDAEAEPLTREQVLEIMQEHRHLLGEDERRCASPTDAPPEAAPG